jgi:ribose/xylose/arabinose/galactoside ABC-type transport system permease subunit
MNKLSSKIKNKKLKSLLNLKEMGILYALILLTVVLMLTNSNFLKINTYLSILRDSSLVGIAAIGMTFAITAQMLDLSVGKMMALIAIINIQLASVIGLWSLPITLLLGLVCGLVNGLLVAKVKLPAFIATLAMFFMYSAIALIVSGEKQVRLTASWFSNISNGSVLGIPNPFIILIVLGLVGFYVLKKTPLGRKIVAIGNSEKAAHNSGINCDSIKILIFILVGLFTAAAAFVISSYLNMADADIVAGYEFSVITAVVLGGTAMKGGKGNIINTIIAAIFLSMLDSAMDMFQINSFVQKIVEGLVLLFAFSMSNMKDVLASYIKKFKKSESLSVKTDI